MQGAEHYFGMLETAGLLRFTANLNSVAEAQAARERATDHQRRLRSVKRQINQEMKETRAHYQAKIASAGIGGAMIFKLLFGKRGGTAGKWRTAAKGNLRVERDDILTDFKNLKAMIDDLLVQIDGAKLQMVAYLESKVK